jgi:hypothetical protein
MKSGARAPAELRAGARHFTDATVLLAQRQLASGTSSLKVALHVEHQLTAAAARARQSDRGGIRPWSRLDESDHQMPKFCRGTLGPCSGLAPRRIPRLDIWP